MKNTPLEDLPFREGGIIRRMGWNSKKADGYRHYKAYTKRFLHSHLGEKWDNVYSKLCNPPEEKKKEYKLIKDSCDNGYCIEISTYEENNKVYEAQYCRELWHNEYYVDNNGILRQYTKNNWRKEWRNQYRSNTKRFEVIDGKYYSQIGGIHYELIPNAFNPEWLKLSSTQQRFYFYLKDLIYGSSTPQECFHRYGKCIYFIDKKQLNSKELKRLGFVNSNS